ncbi:MAG: ABC transporter ATP-binding protein [Candidatus Nanopelagicales bacterium]
MSALIEARALTRTFGRFTAVDEVTFRVAPGEVVGLLGANGAGKTTTIKMLLGLLRPSGGQALLDGAPPSRESRRRLGYVPQGLGLYAELTVKENLAFAAQAFGCAPAALDGPLAAQADTLVSALPLGLRRQLAFLCALQHTPSALVLDEPTSGVGPLARTHLWDRIREEAVRGAGVLVTTHYMQEARQCDRLLLMSDGRLVATGTEADIVDGTRAVKVSAPDWSRTFEALAAAGFMVTLAGRDVRVVDPDDTRLRATLTDAGLDATVTEVVPTIEERMTALAHR